MPRSHWIYRTHRIHRYNPRNSPPIRRALITTIVALAVALLSAHGAAVHAADAPSAADLAALHSFTLNDTFLGKWLAIAADPKAPVKSIDLMTLNQDDQQKSLDGMAATLDARPGVSAYLASRGLGSREYVLGGSTLMLATIEDTRQKHPELSGDSGNAAPLTSPANLAFYRQHKDQIHQTMQAAGRRQLQADLARNGGTMTPDKIGPCVKLSMVGASLTSIAEPGTGGVHPDARLKLAQSFNDLAPKFAEKNLRDDLNDMADEIRRQANAPRIAQTPKFTHGLNDLTAWTRAQCH